MGREVLGWIDLVGQIVGQRVVGREVLGIGGLDRQVLGGLQLDREQLGQQVVGREVLGIGGLGRTVTEGVDQPSEAPADASREASTGAQVWTLICAIALVAAAIIAFKVPGLPTPADAPGHPALALVLLAVGFAVAELAVVYLPIGRNAYSLTLNEIPLVVGLFLLPPTHFVVARLVGAAVPLAWRNRGSVRKLAFNLAQYALEAGTVLVVYHLVLGGTAPLSPRGWLAVGLAVVASDLLGTVLITLVIAAHTRTRPQVQREVISLGPVAPLVNASFALVLIYVITVDWRAVWTVAVVVAVLALAQRSQHNLRRRTESLEQLGRFTGEMGAQSDVDAAAQAAITSISQMLRAEVVELTLAESFAGRARRWTARHDQPVTEPAGDSLAVVLAPWLAGGPVLARRRTRDRALAASLRTVGLRDAVAMPLQGDDGVIGTLVMGDRLGDVETFARSDMRELLTLGNHLSVALRNARRADLIREHVEEQLHRSLHDELTGLPNRRQLELRLNEALPEGGQASAILLDLDRFKEINDTLGHNTGDGLLRMVAGRLRRTAPVDAMVARLGGDEFAVLVLSGDEAATASVAAMVRHAFTLPFELDELQVTVEVSVGVASTGPDADAGHLLREADIAMYAAKTRRTGIEVYRRELEAGSPQRLTVLTELRNAIAHGELAVHFQPKVRLLDGEVIGAEALVRWSHPSRGFIGPDEFVPVAEHSGLITPLTFSVLRQSLDACASWRRAGRPLGVAVNISPRSLLDPAFVDEVARALAAVEVPASAVTLEITESSLMSDPERAIDAMERLRSLGLQLSIDDLGTGYSSLSYLQRLPVSEVKIDRSFLKPDQAEGANADAFAIVGAIVDLGHRLGRHVVAEGVEDGQTWQRLKELGCDSAQGYWMSPALPPEEFAGWLERWQAPRAVQLRVLR
jgi:diguanylate cyclase (GGDEF)-like protein